MLFEMEFSDSLFFCHITVTTKNIVLIYTATVKTEWT